MSTSSLQRLISTPLTHSLLRAVPPTLPQTPLPTLLPQLSAHLQSGSLLPNTLITPLVHTLLLRALSTTPGYLLDGYPRTSLQAQHLIHSFSPSLRPQLIILLKTKNRELLKERMLQRGRVDDEQEVVERRLREYEVSEKEVLEVLEKGGGEIVEVGCGEGRDVLEREVGKVAKDFGRVCVVGPPGSGKGVVGGVLGGEGRMVISVGDVLRGLMGMGERGLKEVLEEEVGREEMSA